MILFIGFLGALAANDIVAMRRLGHLSTQAPKFQQQQVRNLWGNTNQGLWDRIAKWGGTAKKEEEALDQIIAEEEDVLDQMKKDVDDAILRYEEIKSLLVEKLQQQTESKREVESIVVAQKKHADYPRLSGVKRNEKLSKEDNIPYSLRKLRVDELKLRKTLNTLNEEIDELRDEARELEELMR